MTRPTTTKERERILGANFVVFDKADYPEYYDIDGSYIGPPIPPIPPQARRYGDDPYYYGRNIVPQINIRAYVVLIVVAGISLWIVVHTMLTPAPKPVIREWNAPFVAVPYDRKPQRLQGFVTVIPNQWHQTGRGESVTPTP